MRGLGGSTAARRQTASVTRVASARAGSINAGSEQVYLPRAAAAAAPDRAAQSTNRTREAASLAHSVRIRRRLRGTRAARVRSVSVRQEAARAATGINYSAFED